ncbi:Cytochrome P450 [Dillenia turbinata]|uniref:Cytochrome P450 n=1 Tax=Dillenia turbinata TaxID=194707 RepID=A0AAN8ZJ76_9MAGN
MDPLYYYLVLFILLYVYTKQVLKKIRNLPPSPPFSLPVVGHLHLLKLNQPLHRTLTKLGSTYGPILLLKFGSRPVLLVSSPSAAEECLTKNDIVFANRPRFLAGKYLGYNYTTLVWASYGQHWRNLRRIASAEILSSHRLQMLSGIRLDEVRLLIRQLHRSSSESPVVEMKSKFIELMLNIIMRMISGKRYYGENGSRREEHDQVKRFKEIVRETLEVSGATNVGDFVPIVNWFGFLNKKGLEKRLVVLQEKRDKFMQALIDEHRLVRSGCDEDDDHSHGRGKTMIDVLLSLQKTEAEYYSDEIIRGLILVMLGAGTDTSAATSEWALSLLLNNPECLKKAQAEIDAEIGHNRLIEESDLAQLPYLRNIINETLRMYPVSPVLSHHESSEECSVGGFRIPRGTMLFVNLWALQNSPELWVEPDKFKPERFTVLGVERDGSVMMPFGSGRRACPGEGLAMRVLGLVLGSLIQCFEWERPSEDMVDMTEGIGLTMPKARPLLAKCTPRRSMLKLLSQI